MIAAKGIRVGRIVSLGHILDFKVTPEACLPFVRELQMPNGACEKSMYTPLMYTCNDKVYQRGAETCIDLNIAHADQQFNENFPPIHTCSRIKQHSGL